MGRVVNGKCCPWDEFSMGRVVHGASGPQGKYIVLGTRGPWGELSRDEFFMEKVVHGESLFSMG
jgi:hypothetical protein